MLIVSLKGFLRLVGLLCLAAVVFQVVTFCLSAEHLYVKARVWNDRSDSESNTGRYRHIVGTYNDNASNRNGFLVNPRSVWPTSDRLRDRIWSQLKVLRLFAKTRNITTSTKVILRVGQFNFNHLNWQDGQKHLVENRCPITNCLFTSNESLLRTADAVAISEFNWKDIDRLGPKAAHQIWIALFMEPPHQRPFNSRALGDLVNWTMSYQSDSTIVIPYGKWIPVPKFKRSQTSEAKYENRVNCSSRGCLGCFNRKFTNCVHSVNCSQRTGVTVSLANCSEATYTNCSNLNCSQFSQLNCKNCLDSNVNFTSQSSTWLDITHISAVNYAKGRTKKVAMFVSNCKDLNGRRRYAWELGKYISVDVYGDCEHSLTCRRSEQDRCHDMLKRDYKFYLAFENSNCAGYITEKLHRNALRNDLIPIVMGARAKDYAFAAPPGSYIHVEDFLSPRHLAEYLNQLDASDTLYNEYFRYKDHFRYLDMHETRYWCRLCGLLHLRDYVDYVTWYKDFDLWTKTSCSNFQDGRKPWKTWKKGNTETSFSKELVEILLTMVK